MCGSIDVPADVVAIQTKCTRAGGEEGEGVFQVEWAGGGWEVERRERSLEVLKSDSLPVLECGVHQVRYSMQSLRRTN